MNKITIAILIIILIIALFMLYSYLTKPSNLTNTISISSTNAQIISANKLQGGGNSTNCTYSLWVYLNSTRGITSDKMNPIISRGTNGQDSSNKTPFYNYNFVLFFSLLNLKTPISATSTKDTSKAGVCLYCTFKNTANSQTYDNNLIRITSDFPIQQWTQITVVVKNNKNVDYFLNGKLVYSYSLYSIENGTGDIKLGSTDSNAYYYYKTSSGIREGTTDAYVAKLNYFAKALNPQAVYNNFLDGVGTGMSLPDYNLKLSLLNNNVEQKYYSLY